MGSGRRRLARLWGRRRDLRARCGRRWRNWRRSMRLSEGRGLRGWGCLQNLAGEAPVAPWLLPMATWLVPLAARGVALLVAVLACFLAASAQTSYQPSAENLKARQEFQDMKFGMFIHWGVYSVLGDGEWIFHERKLTVHEYERLPHFFDPEKFDAKA